MMRTKSRDGLVMESTRQAARVTFSLLETKTSYELVLYGVLRLNQNVVFRLELIALQNPYGR